MGGPANVVAAETVAGVLKEEDPRNYMLPRPQRKILETSNRYTPQLRASRGSLAKTLSITSDFHGGSRLQRVIRFYEDLPRIDFEINLELRAQEVLITVDFPLADDVVERARGIPFGFASFDPRHPFRPLEEYLGKRHTEVGVGESEFYAFSDAILPAVRWSHYQLAGGVGIGLLDRGLTGHELSGGTVTLGLINSHAC